MKWFITSAVLMIAGGIFLLYGGETGPSPDPGPTPAPFNDIATKAFADTETAWRTLQGEKAVKLRAGELKSETESVAWFQTNYSEAFKAAWKPVLSAEYEEFGAEKWTAEKEAAVSERYVR